ncbi:MAG: hypothetical protein IJS63_09370 [Bacteroidaceae bacterium]|nr:hypothetical protein [Bacteroidaceae bacterium]
MIFIDNIQDLLRDIERYKQMFPTSYTTYEQLKMLLEDKDGEPVGSTFGFSVAGEYEDKCYGFESDMVTPTNTIFRYMGIWKC